MAVRVVPVVLGIAAGCRSSGHEGTVQGEKALFEFFEGKLPEGR